MVVGEYDAEEYCILLTSGPIRAQIRQLDLEGVPDFEKLDIDNSEDVS